MTFRWQGKTYDTADMTRFETGNPLKPFVYRTTDGTRVFVVRIDRLEGIEIRPAEAAEIKVLAERHHFPELLKSLPPEDCDEPDKAASPPSEWHALIVEDDGASRHALGKLLNQSGWATSSAATISEAQCKLGQHPRYVILDLNLPDGQGTAILEWIRSENLPIKVAVTTASSDPELLSSVLKLRPDALFKKPIDLPELLSWLEAA